MSRKRVSLVTVTLEFPLQSVKTINFLCYLFYKRIWVRKERYQQTAETKRKKKHYFNILFKLKIYIKGNCSVGMWSF